MTGQDRAMLLGCFATALLVILSLSAASVPVPAAPVMTAQLQPVQSAQLHALTGATRSAVSMF
jgi:hypothetical protein